MITFPPYFTAIKFPGYFWNTVDKQLYTIKVTGILRPLKRNRPNKYNKFIDSYRISVGGCSLDIPVTYLKSLKHEPSVIPVQDDWIPNTGFAPKCEYVHWREYDEETQAFKEYTSHPARVAILNWHHPDLTHYKIIS